MRKPLGAIALAVTAAVFLTSCGQGDGPAESAGSSDAGALVVYTNSNSEGRGEWLQAKAAKPGFEIVGACGADATNKLIAEKTTPLPTSYMD